MTRCKQRTFAFHRVGRREISAKFDAPAITSDAVGLLLRELEQKLGLVERFSDRFHDWGDPRFAKHSKQELLAQRIFGLALGYEDLNDHEQSRHDPLMAVLAGKREPARCVTYFGVRRRRALGHDCHASTSAPLTRSIRGCVSRCRMNTIC
jgi:hypothetical protein